jgi:hypothetical protein
MSELPLRLIARHVSKSLSHIHDPGTMSKNLEGDRLGSDSLSAQKSPCESSVWIDA